MQLPALPNGTFLVSHPKQGQFTVKLHTARSGASAGQRILSLAIGATFRAVAVWHEELEWAQMASQFVGPASVQPVTPWHYQHGGGWSASEQKLAIMLDLALRGTGSHFRASGYALEIARRCVVCNGEVRTEGLRCSSCP